MTNDEAMKVLRILVVYAKERQASKRVKLARIVADGREIPITAQAELDRTEYIVQQTHNTMSHFRRLIASLEQAA